jgi:hypothetical protein
MDTAHQNKKKTTQPKSEKKKHWLLGRSTLSIESKFLLYKAYGPMEFSYGGQPPIPTSKSSRSFKPRLSDPFGTHLAI